MSILIFKDDETEDRKHDAEFVKMLEVGGWEGGRERQTGREWEGEWGRGRGREGEVGKEG